MFYESQPFVSRILDDSSSSFTANNRESFIVLKILIFIVVIISMLSALYIIAIYIFYPKTRNFAFKMVFYLNLADFFYSVAELFTLKDPNFLFDVEFSEDLCKAQSFMLTWFGLSSIIWTSIIAWTLYSTVILNTTNIEEKEGKYIFLGFVLPLIASVLPLITKDYGSNGIWCWFGGKDEIIKQTILEISFIYMEIWFALIFNAVIFYKVISVLKYVAMTTDGSWIRKLRFYPLILIICWIWGSVHKIYSLVNPTYDHSGIKWLIFLHFLFCSLQGAFNAFIYGFNASVTKIFSGCFCCCLSRGTLQNEDINNDQNGGVELDSITKHARDSLSSTFSYDARDSIEVPEFQKKSVLMKELSDYVLG